MRVPHYVPATLAGAAAIAALVAGGGAAASTRAAACGATSAPGGAATAAALKAAGSVATTNDMRKQPQLPTVGPTHGAPPVIDQPSHRRAQRLKATADTTCVPTSAPNATAPSAGP